MKPWPLLLLVIGLTAAQLYGQAEVRSEKNWEVSGVVRAKSGALRDLYMSIIGPEIPNRPVRTDASGKYRVTGVLPGTYTISMQQPDDESAARPRTITLAPGDRIENFDFVVREGASVSGKVTDRSGRPVSGIVVVAYLRWQMRGQPRVSMKGGGITDDRGGYRIGNLPDGTYLVAAAPTLRKPLRPDERQAKPAGPLASVYPSATFAPGSRNLASAVPITARSGTEYTSADIVLEREPAYCVFFRPNGIALSAGGDVQIAVTLTEWLGTQGPSIVTGTAQLGRETQICGVPEGEYQLSLVAYSKRPMKGLGYGRQTVVVTNRHVELGAIEPSGMLPLTGNVTVRGAGKDSPIPQGLRISLQLLNRGLLPSDVLEGEVREDGTFALAGVYADTYGLRVDNLPKGYYVAEARQAGKDVLSPGVSPGDAPVRIVLAPDGPVISGRVLSPEGDPVVPPDVPVLLLSKSGEAIHSANADQSGFYRFPSGIAPGDYRIAAFSELPEASHWSPEMARQYESRLMEIRLNPHEVKTLDLICPKDK